jgi:hypothetical protein
MNILHAGYVPPQPVNNVPVTASVLGMAVPIIFGTYRVPTILAWRGDLTAKPESAGGGKGKSGKATMYIYSASFVGILCEGPILGVHGIWDQTGQLPTGGVTATFGYMPTPAAPTLSSTAGGSLAAATYYATITYTDATGESAHSAEASLAVAADNLLVVTSPASAPPDVTGYNVYVATTSGGEVLQNTGGPIAIGSNWTLPTSGLVQNTPPHPQHSHITPHVSGSGGAAGGSSTPAPVDIVNDRGLVHPTLGVLRRIPY